MQRTRWADGLNHYNSYNVSDDTSDKFESQFERRTMHEAMPAKRGMPPGEVASALTLHGETRQGIVTIEEKQITRLSEAW
jgi:hypothetical protein